MGTVWGSLFWKTIPKQGSVSGMLYVFSGTVSAEIVLLFLGLEKKNSRLRTSCTSLLSLVKIHILKSQSLALCRLVQPNPDAPALTGCGVPVR